MGDATSVGRLSTRRYWSDTITRWVIGFGGAAVIAAITLIFAYLLWVVAPILMPGDIDEGIGFAVVDREPLLVDVSENGEVFVRMSRSGIVEFYAAESGKPIAGFNLGYTVKSAQRVYPTVDLYAIVNEQNQLSFVKTEFHVGFVEGVRQLTPKLSFPYLKSNLALNAADILDVQLFESDLLVAAGARAAQTFELIRVRNVETGLALRRIERGQFTTEQPIDRIFVGPRNEWLYALNNKGLVTIVSTLPLNTAATVGTVDLAPDGGATAFGAVLGRYSLLVADSTTQIAQWGVFKSDNGLTMRKMREFDSPNIVERFVSEPRRKGFASIDDQGVLALHYPTSGRCIANLPVDFKAASVTAISPRSNLIIAAPGNTTISTYQLQNKHPEISMSTLWQEVWYEGYEEPVYSWQSSSADNDFEPKFSLTPLAFGTLKAAFYALLFAVPIAIMGAIYTAYFMSPAMRAWVKPGIEIMAALPTVILGFIGGLWLAPIIEAHLSSVLSIFIALPVGLFVFALLWSQVPEKITRPFEGWYGLLVTPLIVITVYVAFDLGPVLEDGMFGGDSKTWFREVLGLSYDQRNALVVGIVMGLAVIPAIFSIAEDAIYGVPTHLINGSLALGATPWQTLVRVVLLTASPGIFSAVMIGMGRAVGETMIVLMATGNTPLMDFNIFEGMRTFAANIAVELPESEVNSSHYRILFLAALVLFMLTFVFNTLAEIVRQRLRARYGSL